MKPSEMQRVIVKAWSALRDATKRESSCPWELDKCLEAAIETEKAHRRWMSGHAPKGYRLSVERAARLSVMRATYEPRRRPKSWQDAASTRRDIVLCQALREKLVSEGLWPQAFPDPSFMAIDYASDVAA